MRALKVVAHSTKVSQLPVPVTLSTPYRVMLKTTFLALLISLKPAVAVTNDEVTQPADISTALFAQQDPYSQETDDLDDDFDDIEASLENSFLATDEALEARFNAVHKAIQAAYRKQTAKIEVVWPNSPIVPNGSTWVAYSDDYEERVVYDFEEGFYQVEVLKTPDTEANLKRLSSMVKKLSASPAKKLAELDVFTRAIDQEIARVRPTDKDPVPTQTNKPSQDEDSLELEQNLDSVNSRRGMFKNANYNILASVSTPAPELNVKELLARLAQQNNDKLSLQNDEESLAVNKTDAISQVDDLEQAELANIPINTSGLIIEPVASTQSTDDLELVETANGWSLKVPFVNNYQKTLIDQRMQTINKMSNRFDVDVSLILAIIEAESSFNPMATSHIPAFGLMQLVPKTAGIDAYRHVYGKHRVLSPEYLYDVENNLELGTAYIDVLQSRYLRGVTNPTNKLYSMVASYNTGVGNLANTVTGSKRIRSAISRINEMQPQAYYDFLQANLPALETKRYLEKVMTKRQKYQYLDKQ